MTLDHFDSCVIGAGVIGLAIGRQLACAGQSVLIVEQHALYGSETSSRNSEVIHAGIYYPSHSLKARFCVSGRDMLYRYCAENHIAHRRIGKLIVAHQAQEAALAALKQQAEANGVLDLQWLDRGQLQRIEPRIEADLALLSPTTGIIDSHQLMDTLAAEIEANGGLISLNCRFIGAKSMGSGFRVRVLSNGEPFAFGCRHLINSGGLYAGDVARRIEGLAEQALPQIQPCKGNYFSLQGRAPFQHLIYPLPEENNVGLGIHATLDLQGCVRFGPDTEYLKHTPAAAIVARDYDVNTDRHATFVEAIRRYYPDLRADRLTPAYAGIRPKLQGPGQAAGDFHIDHADSGLINLFGIESPGLTSCLSIAKHVAALLEQ